MDVRGVSVDIVRVNGGTWSWLILFFSLILLASQIDFDEPKLLEKHDRPPSGYDNEPTDRNSTPKADKTLSKSILGDPYEDFLDALLEEDFRMRDIVVRFPTDDALNGFLSEANERGLRVEDDLARLKMLRVRLANGRQIRDLFELLPEDSEPEPNFPVKVPSLPETEDAQGIMPFGRKAVDWLDAPEDRSTWGEGVLVAVLDTGVDFGHPALGGVRGTSLDLVQDESDEISYAGHGTAVASIIAGNPAVFGGMAPKAEILSVRVLNNQGEGDGFTVANGIIEAVDRGADVINLSLGTIGRSFVLEEAIDYAHEQNVLVVASVGNEGQRGVTYPARFEGVIGVTAVDAKGSQANFSNFGDGVDLAAPGAGVLAAWSQQTYKPFSGTSAATPFVAGALAGLISENQSMPRERLPELLFTYANDDGMPGEDPYVGKGVLDVGRVVGRNVKGTYDVAITGYYFDPEDFEAGGRTPFLVSIQNQGTELIDQATLEVSFGEINKTLLFGKVAVGEVKSQQLYLDAKQANNPEGTRIVSQVTLDGHEDADLDNNERISRITLPIQD